MRLLYIRKHGLAIIQNYAQQRHLAPSDLVKRMHLVGQTVTSILSATINSPALPVKEVPLSGKWVPQQNKFRLARYPTHQYPLHALCA